MKFWEMKLVFLLLTLILEFQKSVTLEEVQNEGNSSAAMISHQEMETDILESTEPSTDGVSALKSSVPLSLPELYVIAKNISHARGMYQQPNKFVILGNQDLRRSVVRKVSITSELDAIKRLLNTLEDSKNILEDLDEIEYFVHQYDVAVSFATVGGFGIVSPFLFSSNDHIVRSAASILGAAMQSNPVVQKLALKQNVGKDLLQLLSHKSFPVLSRVIFALASFLRNAPEAQEEFFTMGGVLKLAEILRNPQLPTYTKMKVINLFGDLAVEYQTSLYSDEEGGKYDWKLDKLFTTQMLTYDVCSLISSFLNVEDLVSQQKIVVAMTSVLKICLKPFQNDAYIISRLNLLIERYTPEFYAIPLGLDFKIILYNELQVLLKSILGGNGSESSSDYYMKKTEL